jgi:hypothetical protein
MGFDVFQFERDDTYSYEFLMEDGQPAVLIKAYSHGHFDPLSESCSGWKMKGYDAMVILETVRDSFTDIIEEYGREGKCEALTLE